MYTVKQTYHGVGDRFGYKYEVVNKKDEVIGEIKNVPVIICIGDRVNLGGTLCELVRVYEPQGEKAVELEEVHYVFKEYEPKVDFDLGDIKNNTSN